MNLLVAASVVLIGIVIWQGAALARFNRERFKANRDASEAFETLRKLSRAVEQSPVSVVITDTDGSIEYVNPKFTQVTGYSSDEVFGMNPRILKSGEASPEVYREMWATITAGREWRGEFHNRKKGGELFWEFASISPILDERGQITHFVAVKEDITNRKRAEEALAKSELLFRSLIENALDIIAVVAPDGTVRYVSPSVERLLGREPARVGGLNVFDLIHPDDLPLAKERFQRTLETGTRFEQIEFRVRHSDGSWRILSMIGKPSPPATGARGLIINARDLTESRALEEQLRQAQKMEAVGRLAGGIAHDFNNLLTTIIGYTELATGRMKPEDPSRTDLSEIDKAAHRAADLTRQLLAFSRKQVLQLRVIDLNQVVSDTNKMLRRLIGEDVELVTSLEERLSSVRADTGQIEQVLLNLAVNSRDAMPKGGKLTIETSEVDLDESYSAFHFDVPAGRYVLLAVSDTGTGMDAATLSHVFEPFFTTKEAGKGTGLGLSTVYGVVKQSGGHVTVYSEPGVGTTFKIYLPRVEGVPEKDRASSVNAALVGGTETVLVVEDEDAVRRLTCRSLEAQGYVVLPAASARQALFLCGKHAGEIHLLITDVVMPGVSGRELARSAAVLRPRMKVLFMSGYTDDAIVQHGVLAAGAFFLQKPFTPRSLAQKVREVLDAGKAA
jgi:two-component system cell cycle sensor histidine kinase/response regulator CckA